MRKNNYNLLFLFAAVSFMLKLVSCSGNIAISDSEDDVLFGKISGRVMYSNLDELENGGIIVLIERTDGSC